MKNYEVNVNRLYQLTIGYAGENMVQRITFDYSAWQEMYGDGALSLLLQRPHDSEPYPVLMNDGVWEVSKTDTAVEGIGKIQLIYTVGQVVKKSAVTTVSIQKSLEAGETPPSPYEPWLNSIIEARDEALSAAEEAREHAEDAAESAADAENRVYGVGLSMDVVDGIVTVSF